MNWYNRFLRFAWSRGTWYILSSNVSREVSLYIRDNYSGFKEDTEIITNMVSNDVAIKLFIAVFNQENEEIVTANEIGRAHV